MTTAEIEKSIGTCGLVCVLCSNSVNCMGCRCNDTCEINVCSSSKGLTHCCLCGEWPCDKDMHKGIRGRAFNAVAKNEGISKLAEYLSNNLKRGITYHRPDRLPGDYDRCQTEQEVIELLKNGKPDPYKVCPVYETNSFILRMVSYDDAAELLECYSDPNSQKLFNSDNCTSDFIYSSLDEMQACIELWLSEYKKGHFVRFSIADKAKNRVIGTIEIFGGNPGVLRIDISSDYENEDYLSELVYIADTFYYDFKCESIITKAIPEARERINALIKSGYAARPKNNEWMREYYYIKRFHAQEI